MVILMDQPPACAERMILVPVLIEAVDLPFGFKRIQAADLVHWNGNVAHPGFMELVGAVESQIRA